MGSLDSFSHLDFHSAPPGSLLIHAALVPDVRRRGRSPTARAVCDLVVADLGTGATITRFAVDRR